MNKRELGVVIARFQSFALTPAHQYLLSQVATRVARVLVLLGAAPVVGLKRNPLEVSLRMRMVEDFWAENYPNGPELWVVPLRDCPHDQDWVHNVDSIIDSINVNGPAIVFCGPDGAGPAYTAAGGKWPVEVLDSMGGHASKVRDQIIPRHSEDFRAGVIYAVERRFTNPSMVVDVLVFDGDRVLLAHKRHDGDKWRLIGGFVDVTDKSLEHAAAREVREETGIEVGDLVYRGSSPVADWRYREGPEGILSAVFTARHVFGSPVASDDIDKIGWFKASDALDNIHPTHRKLLEIAGGAA